ncbi:MAG: NAD-dependent epimerase/dehydratase family protein [Chitinispirillales bacterium]|nr:NAD-dependent epimerase/dehydratase family protein [Chitinispirillales bacterium]
MTFLENPLYIKDMRDTIDVPLPWDKLNGARILITGAGGLISSFLVDCLMYRNSVHKANISVHALCRNEEKARKRFGSYEKNENFYLIIQDVCDSLNSNLDFDYIIHAASNAHPLAYATAPVETMKANLLGSINLLEYAKKHKIKKFMFISSSEIYGQNDSSADKHLTEDYSGYINCAELRAAYPESKRVSETLCTAYKKEYGVNTVVVRPGHIYGSAMTEENSRADAQFIRNAIDGVDIVMKSAGNQLRSYCYVSDAVSAIFYVLLLGEDGGAYNIANKNSMVTIRELAEILSDISKVKVVFENPNDVEKSGYSIVGNIVMDARRLENLGWEARHNIKSGLMRTIGILKS